MGTRHLICVVKNGEYKVAQYGQWDGYPEGQGLGVLEFLSKEMDRELFEGKVCNLSYITDEEYDQRWEDFGVNLEESDGLVDWETSKSFGKKYPELSRDTSSNILNIIQNSNREIKLHNNLEFAASSLFCEWGYVIDLDKNTFEVYEGFNQVLLEENERFAKLNSYSDKITEKYYPIKHVISFSLDNLPSEKEFLSYFINEDDE